MILSLHFHSLAMASNLLFSILFTASVSSFPLGRLATPRPLGQNQFAQNRLFCFPVRTAPENPPARIKRRTMEHQLQQLQIQPHLWVYAFQCCVSIACKFMPLLTALSKPMSAPSYVYVHIIKGASMIMTWIIPIIKFQIVDCLWSALACLRVKLDIFLCYVYLYLKQSSPESWLGEISVGYFCPSVVILRHSDFHFEAVCVCSSHLDIQLPSSIASSV